MLLGLAVSDLRIQLPVGERAELRLRARVHRGGNLCLHDELVFRMLFGERVPADEADVVSRHRWRQLRRLLVHHPSLHQTGRICRERRGLL